jgi:hypothetical protein
MDTEVIRLIENLKSISNRLGVIYEQQNRRQQERGKCIENNGDNGMAGPTETVVQNQAPVVQQPVSELPVLREQGGQHSSNGISNAGSPKTVSGNFDNMLLLPTTNQDNIIPEVIQPQQISDKERIKQLETEIAMLHRQQNVNFNFAPVTIGGTNGQGNN